MQRAPEDTKRHARAIKRVVQRNEPSLHIDLGQQQVQFACMYGYIDAIVAEYRPLAVPIHPPRGLREIVNTTRTQPDTVEQSVDKHAPRGATRARPCVMRLNVGLGAPAQQSEKKTQHIVAQPLTWT